MWLKAFSLSIKRETCIESIQKCIKHHQEHHKAEPGKDLEIPFHQEIPQVAESV